MERRAASLVVAGASAGGVEPLKALIAALPADLPAAVAVVFHVAAEGSRLPEILDRAGPLSAAHAKDGDALVAGRVYVAPPDRHLLVRDSKCVVVRGPRENGARPAVDPLFRSAAVSFRAAILAGGVDEILSLGEIAPAVIEFARNAS